MRKLLFRFYWVMQRLIVPDLRNSQAGYLEYLRMLLRPGVRWLELGCGHQLFPEWLGADEIALVRQAAFVAGIDFDYESLRQNRAIRARVHGDVHNMPFADASFDLVTANMVVEHIDDTSAALTEIRRVLKPGGIFCFHTSNFHSPLNFIAARTPQKLKNKLIELLESRKEHDVYRVRHRLNTSAEIQRQARGADFEVAELRLLSTSAAFVMLGPVVLIELLFIRLLRIRVLAGFRSNIIAVLRRRAPAHEHGIQAQSGNR